jgi:hypothetical protein
MRRMKHPRTDSTNGAADGTPDERAYPKYPGAPVSCIPVIALTLKKRRKAGKAKRAR